MKLVCLWAAALLVVGCAKGELLPVLDNGMGPETSSVLDAADLHAGDLDGGLDHDSAPASDLDQGPGRDMNVDLSDLGGDITLCGGTPCTDNLPCTDDLCLDGGCTHVVKSGFCAIGGACHADKAKNGSTCQVCDVATSQTAWTGDATLCTDDAFTCTTTTCTAGACGHAIKSGSCLIGSKCHASGATNPAAECMSCQPGTSTSTWSARTGAAPCSADGISCTLDVCKAGACTHDLKSGFCWIGKVCRAAGAKNPTMDCRTCQPTVSTTTWSVASSGSCTSDGTGCTADLCQAGTCTHILQPGFCLISGQCYAAGVNHPYLDCQSCQTGVSTTTWSSSGNGALCSSDGNSCTSNVCQGGGCTHPVQGNNCLIGGVCYAGGAVNPSVSCSYCKPLDSKTAWSPITYAGCCAGSTVYFCNAGTLDSLDCSANPACGWESSFGYYDCGTPGGTDPSGSNPKDC